MAMGGIDLAAEPDFTLGPWQVHPSRGLVRRERAEVRLEPRIMQALVVLARAGGRTLSRTQWVQTAWGQAGEDESVGRCVARLRAVLAVDGVIAIETIPETGERLVISTPEQKIVPGVQQNSVSPSDRAPRLWLPVAVMVLTMGIAAALLWQPGQREETAPLQVLPVTSDPGREVEPALSPGGGQLAYAADRAGQGFDIWVQSLAGGAATRLTDDADDDRSPAWAPDGGRIAFVRVRAGQPCRILVRPVPSGPERVVGTCATHGATRLAWLDADRLVYGDRVGEGPARLWSLSLSGPQAGVPVALTDPPAGLLGDGDPALSPDGRRLAYMRHRTMGVADVRVRDLTTGQERQVTDDGDKLEGLDWSGDGRWLLVASSRTGDFGLWRVDPAGVEPPVRLAPGLNQLGRVAAAGDRVVAEVRTRQSALLRLDPDAGPVEAVSPANRLDWDPDVSPRGALAFASDRSGMFEIWVAEPGAAPAPVTRFAGPFTQSPRWAPDGRRLALVSTVDGVPGLFILDRAGGKLKRVAPEPGGEDRAPAWSKDGQRLYFASNREGGWRIWITRPPYEEAMPITAAGWRAARESADGKWLYLAHATQAGLWRQPADGGPAEKVSDLPAPQDAENWVVGPAGIYVIDRTDAAVSRVVLLPADGGPAQVAATLSDPLSTSSLALDPQGRLLVGQDRGTLVDLVQVRPPPSP